jgi:hypothetical protein
MTKRDTIDRIALLRQVFELLGGMNATAAILKRHRSGPYKFVRPKDRNGTGGDLPVEDIRRIIEWAHLHRVPVPVHMLLGVDPKKIQT